MKNIPERATAALEPAVSTKPSRACAFKVSGEPAARGPWLIEPDLEPAARIRAGGKSARRRRRRWAKNLQGQRADLCADYQLPLPKDKEISDRWRGFPGNVRGQSRHLANRVEREGSSMALGGLGSRPAYPAAVASLLRLEGGLVQKEGRLAQLGIGNAPLAVCRHRPYPPGPDAQNMVLTALPADFSHRNGQPSPSRFLFYPSPGSMRRCGPAKAPGAFSHPTTARRRTPTC